MRQLYILMLLFTTLTGFASPPVIQNPTPIVLCDPNNDGFQAFDLSVKVSEVLGALDPNLYNLTFHETQLDADTNGVTIPNPTSYYNITSWTQTLYIRVEDNADSSSFSVTTLDLILNATPNIGATQNLSIEQIPFVGTAIFDLTTNENELVNGLTAATVAYYTSLADAQNNTNQISLAVGLDPAAFIGTNGQVIWERVELTATQCASFASFHLYITNPDIVFIPDPIFKNYLVNHNPTIDSNANGEIEYTEAANYYNLFLIGNINISDLTGVEAFTNLTQLHCDINNLTSLNVSGLTNLSLIYCGFNQLTSLNVSGCTGLMTLECNNNQLTNLDVSGLYNLHELLCNDNALTSLNFAGTNLTQLNCQINQLSSIDVSNSVSLQSLGVANNPISTLDVSNLVNLQYLFCYNNLLSTLDASHCTSLINLVFNGNPNLTTVYMKNGRDEGVNLSDLPNLQYICADDSQIDNVQQLLSAQGMSTVANSYCSFTPGGNYNTISGTVTYDADNNGCDVSDGTYPNIKVKLGSPTELGASFTNATGNYTFYTGAGSFEWQPDAENPTWFSVSPSPANTTFADANNNTITQNFCVAPNGIHPDLEIVIAPLTNARPGFSADYKIVYKNKGNQTLSQLNGINLVYDASKVDFISADQTPSSVGSGTVSWDFANMQPFESRSITLSMVVHTPLDPNPTVNGDILSFTTTINPTDEIPADNTFHFNQTVVGSFDPNDITCLEGNMVSPIEIGNYLHYIINFENIGTADAENIVVRDVIDPAQFDIDSMQILSSSADVTARVTGNLAEFIFSNINLHSGGHGNILIKVRSNNSLVQGDSVNKKASIYFDYNAPVETPQEDTIFQALSNSDYETDASISVYPNPSKGNVNINCNNTIKSVQLFDVQGRLLETDLVNQTNTVIDISSKSKGVYFLKIISDKGIGVEKIVRE